MEKEFINPNLHVILIHYPLGVFVLGVLLELFSFLYRRSSVRTAARWMILLGALASIPSAFTGLYALADVARRSLPPEAIADGKQSGPWHELAAATQLTPEQWHMLSRHAWLQGIGTALAVFAAVVGLGCSNRARRALHLPLLLLLLISLGLFASGAWFGGEVVYRYGTATKLPSYDEGTSARSEAPVGAAAAREQTEKKLRKQIEYYAPPLQTHVLLAGLMVAVALASVGLSIRAVVTANELPDEDVASARAFVTLETTQPYGMDMARSLNPDARVGRGPVLVPAARFWLLAVLFGILTAGAGWWVLAQDVGWAPKVLWANVVNPNTVRRLAHVIGAGSLIVLPLILALLARGASRHSFLLGLFALLLIVVVAAQIWLGILLLYDQPDTYKGEGPFYRLRQPASSSNVAASDIGAPAHL